MALPARKRKRGATSTTESSSPDNSNEYDIDYQDLIRKAFEKKFRPLEIYNAGKEAELDNIQDPAEESDWNGIDSDEDEEQEQEQDEQTIAVVDYSATTQFTVMSKAEKRAFMQSRPLLVIQDSKARQKGVEEPDGEEKLNLKNDLALQRLINESHLLHPSSRQETIHKQKLLDMRLQSLGSKSSFMQQEKMPMAHRKGMIAKAADREDLRRREAKENGVILEKPKKQKTSTEPKRLRGMGGPAVGKFKGGTLSLSRKDVMGIKKG